MREGRYWSGSAVYTEVVNSAIYPEEVEHLAARYGAPRRLQIELEVDPEFERAFRASLRRRRAEVALLIRRTGGEILVTTKTFYPSGIFRLPTGGVKPGEAVEEALWREMQEETGLQATHTSFGALLEYRIIAGESKLHFATYMFLMDVADGDPLCSDPDEQICEYQEIAPLQLRTLARDLSNLGPGWRSWGIWRAIPHRAAAELLTGCAGETPEELRAGSGD